MCSLENFCCSVKTNSVENDTEFLLPSIIVSEKNVISRKEQRELATLTICNHYISYLEWRDICTSPILRHLVFKMMIATYLMISSHMPS